MFTLNRRSFFTSCSILLAPPTMHSQSGGQAGFTATPPPSFPSQDPDLVREMVGVSHGNLARVRELVERRPTLARAAWDWGFGDWESAIGAASHMGNREIAEFLLSHGARPTIFSAAMLGQVHVVKAFVEASPGIQRTKGPHGITLLSHATAGGTGATAVADYLTSIGGADDGPSLQPLPAEEMDSVRGSYRFGPADDERIEVAVSRGQLTFARAGRVGRFLFHVGSLEFFPAGAEAVRIGFTRSSGATVLTVRDPDVVMVATKGVV